MAISLGMRVSGLLVVGAVAVAVAAFGGDGSGTPDGGGGGATIVTVGPSSSARSFVAPKPSGPRESPAGEASRTVLPNSPSHSGETTPAPLGTSSPTPSSSPRYRLLASPVWLPPGPLSPDTGSDAHSAPDPSSVYDRLRDPHHCRADLGMIPTSSSDPEWRVLRGLADACLAVQGEGGSWSAAAQEYAGAAGKAGTCKGRAAYAVLGALLDFHRRYPGAGARLTAASDAPPACDYRIAGVDPGGGDARVRPGDTVAIELRDTYFDQAGLLRSGVVLIGGHRLAGPPVARSRSGDRLVLSAVVPSLDRYPQRVDVAVRYGGTEVRLKDALTVAAPAVVPSPGGSSGTPQGVLTLGPLTADLSGP
jgi:hypothetical protein